VCGVGLIYGCHGRTLIRPSARLPPTDRPAREARITGSSPVMTTRGSDRQHSDNPFAQSAIHALLGRGFLGFQDVDARITSGQSVFGLCSMR
jgi:hypothetical protein